MLFRTVQGIKYSRLMTLPSQVCDALEIEVGDCLGITIENGRIIVVHAGKATKQIAVAASEPLVLEVQE